MFRAITYTTIVAFLAAAGVGLPTFAEAKGKADIGDAVDAAYAANTAIPIPGDEITTKGEVVGDAKAEPKFEDQEDQDQKVTPLEDDDDMSIATVATPQAKGKKKSVKESS